MPVGAAIGVVVGGGGYTIAWALSNLWDLVVGDEDNGEGEEWDVPDPWEGLPDSLKVKKGSQS